MLRSIRLPIVFLFAFPTLIHFSFSYKENNDSNKFTGTGTGKDSSSVSNMCEEPAEIKPADTYTLMNLEEKGLSRDAFDLALKGYNNLVQKRVVRNKNIITVIDFSKPSNQKRETRL